MVDLGNGLIEREGERGAELIADAYEYYRAEFAAVTRRAPGRFSRRDWPGGQADAVERLDLYGKVLSPAISRLEWSLGVHMREKAVWTVMKDAFDRRVAGRRDAALAETFFNSASRKIFSTVGVDPEVEFVSLAASSTDGRTEVPELVVRCFTGAAGTERTIRRLLEDTPFPCGYEDPARDASRVAAAVDERLAAEWGGSGADTLEFVRPVFFRNKGAYLVGRIRRGERVLPLVLALVNLTGRVAVDAVITDENEVSIVFSFTRSYFHVDVDDPAALVAFLGSIMPRKPIAELYIALGYNKHGKTELYRDLLRHLESAGDLFVVAPGETGMVMSVFTLPSFDVVFKVIRDAFAFPKATSRKEVMEKYRLVFRHGRAGRLVDVQEFEHLEFPRKRFSPELLSRLLELAMGSVRVDEERVIIRHLYTERRLVPLNLFLQSSGDDAARAAVLDFGHALRELAANNIFPGDLLLKNFGLTRHGRVVFYDYDELCFLTDCNFRPLPEPHVLDEETSAEPWFYVGENDVFPEEFGAFLGLKGPLRDTFLAEHGDLLTPAFWVEMQGRIRAGEILDVFPYPASCRLGLEGAR